eukprot:m.69307 g.69307  ORF g.69307 m.69307 type:complete len:165 (-) comp12038_c1_seq2:55-549(-)
MLCRLWTTATGQNEGEDTSKSTPQHHQVHLIVSISQLTKNHECPGNLLCSNDLAQLKATCCQAGPEACASVDWQASTNNGCAKHNDKLGWVNDSSFVDYILEGGVGPVPTPTETICFNWTQIGLNPYEPTMVRNIWTQTDLGLFNTSMCLPVDYHDTVLLHLQQ